MSIANREQALGTLFPMPRTSVRSASARHDADGANWMQWAGATIRLWRKRSRDRRELLTLDDHLRRDIGLSRYEIATEARKPFWRA